MGSDARWAVTGPFLGMQLPFLPASPPLAQVSQHPQDLLSQSGLSVVRTRTPNCPLTLVMHPKGCPGARGEGSALLQKS